MRELGRGAAYPQRLLYLQVCATLLGDASGLEIEALRADVRFELVQKARAPRVRATTKEKIAGVILEGVVGNSGFIVPDQAFLEGLRKLCDDNGAVLVFDEVMTGFRISYGGAQAHFGVTPDLTTMGKVIGGGLPVGAYGGRADIMSMVAPAGPMYQAGTLSGNPLAMTAGIKTLELLKRPGAYEQLETTTKRLSDGIQEAAKAAGLPICGSSISAMFGFFLCDGPVLCSAGLSGRSAWPGHSILCKVPTTEERDIHLGRRTNGCIIGSPLEECEALLDELRAH